MSKRRGQSKQDQPTLWSEALPANPSARQGIAPASLTKEGELCSRTLNSLGVSDHAGLYGRMSLVYCPPQKDGTLVPSSTRWPTWGIGLTGGFLTLNGSEFPSDAVVSSLSQVLETTVHPRYCLSARAAQGILTRAERRGKRIVEPLRTALLQSAASGPRDQEAQPETSVRT